MPNNFFKKLLIVVSEHDVSQVEYFPFLCAKSPRSFSSALHGTSSFLRRSVQDNLSIRLRFDKFDLAHGVVLFSTYNEFSKIQNNNACLFYPGSHNMLRIPFFGDETVQIF